MSTRATIGKYHSNGAITSIYSHWDGYYEHVGKMLLEHYNTQEAVDALLELGDISALYPNLSAENHTFETPQPEVTIAYGRDRGEDGCKAKEHGGISSWVKHRKDSWCEFFYLWKDGEWLACDDSDESQLAPLKDRLVES